MKKLLHKLTAWHVLLFFLAVANIAALSSNWFTDVLILGFFLTIPGYLLLKTIAASLRYRWETASMSVGLSVLIFMLGGLLLNSIHVFGVERPLTRLNVYLLLDLISLILLFASRKKFPKPLAWAFRIKHVPEIIGLSLLPVLAAGGAFRLNNGASNILTMIMFGLAAVLFVYLTINKKLSPIYPYAIFTIGLAVLFSTSLRGWYITGHDIQHEFRVFQITNLAEYWNVSYPKGDPYNACLSITLLPTLINKLLGDASIYIYKFVFQTIFAVGLVPIYFLVKQFSNKRVAFISTLVFISFPPFFNDLPFLNRQEIAFVFFGLLLMVNFQRIGHRAKTILTVLTLLGVILSHYSSGYVALAIVIPALPMFKLLHRRWMKDKPIDMPLLRTPILFAAFLFTFLWNAQITTSAGGLQETITKTAQGFLGDSDAKSSGTSYSLFSAPAQNPAKTLNQYAKNNADKTQYIPEAIMPQTGLGKIVSKVIDSHKLNVLLRNFSAKILQVLLLIGICVSFWRIRKKPSLQQAYAWILSVICLVLLVLMTLLPELSADYSVTRLFQQTLIITAPFMVIAADLAFKKFKHGKLATTSFFAILFLDLSGFIPQALGGYPPQLALNNSGTYYNIYLLRPGEITAANWLMSQPDIRSIAADQYAKMRLPDYPFTPVRTVNPVIAGPSTNYLYQDYANKDLGQQAIFLNGNVIEYTYESPLQSASLVYASQDSTIYAK